jgi:hypothetical protein
MVEIPVVVQRFVFPVLTAIGSAFGTYKKYTDAPAPLKRPQSIAGSR